MLAGDVARSAGLVWNGALTLTENLSEVVLSVEAWRLSVGENTLLTVLWHSSSVVDVVAI